MQGALETRGEISAFLGWSWRKVLRLRETKGLPVQKLDGRWMASKEALAEWLKEQTRTKAEAQPAKHSDSSGRYHE